jgi:3-hydroxy-9,10-secoandrosta-1,3,5(10)-triene-9,17-dione monooxygenase reductase component
VLPDAVPSIETRAPFTGRDFRDVLGRFASGVTVITTDGIAGPYALTANAFSSLSLDPPLVLVCVAKSGRAIERLRANGVFVVNILGGDQVALSQYFASRDRARDGSMLADVAHRTGTSMAAILDGVLGYVDCRLTAAHDAGDHIILVGEVLDLGKSDAERPLVFYQGKYRELKE